MRVTPRIATIDDAEMIRDGGSWFLTVSDLNGLVYTLFSKVEVDATGSGKWKRIRYDKPLMSNELLGSKVEIEFYEAFEMLDEGEIVFQSEIKLKWFYDAKRLFQMNGEIFESIRYVGN